MSRAAALLRLQQIDSDLDSRRAGLGEIEVALADDAAVRAAQAEAAAVEALAAELKQTSRALESGVQSIAEKIAEVEKRLYGGKVSHPKELQDLQAEAESLKRRRAESEDRLLESMMELEEAEKSRAAAEQAVSQAERRRSEANAGLLTDQATLENAIAKLEIEREATEASIPVGDRELYASLRGRKRGVAITRVVDSACGSCGVAPSSSRLQAARQGGELIRCGNCERILYAE